MDDKCMGICGSVALYWYWIGISGYIIIFLYVRFVSGENGKKNDVFFASDVWIGLCNGSGSLFDDTEAAGNE